MMIMINKALIRTITTNVIHIIRDATTKKKQKHEYIFILKSLPINHKYEKKY